MSYDPNDPEIRSVLLPDSLKELLVDFNKDRINYVRVPLHAFERNKEALIAHALGEDTNLTDWHTIVRDPHAIAHVISDGNIVYVVPPILTRIPTLNPKHGHMTLSKAAADHDRDGSRLPIAAENTLRKRFESYKRPEYTDKATQEMWIALLTKLGVYERDETSQPIVEDDNYDDDFNFD